MATDSKEKDDWSEAIGNLTEAARMNLTATRLATAGIVALSAASVAYLWDPGRRNQLLDAARRFTGGASWWGDTGEPQKPPPGTAA